MAEPSARRAPRLWIVDPSVHVPETQGVEQVLAEWRADRRVFLPLLAPGDGPRPGTGYDADGVVVLGSAASVHDAFEPLSDLADWLRPLVTGEVRRPLLGVCYGHQLFAHLAGAMVGPVRAGGEKLHGVETTRLDGRLLPGPAEARVVVSHAEEVKTVPRGFRVSATRPGVPVDGLEHDTRPVFSFQFHPEAREEFALRAGIEPHAIDARVREDGRRILAAFAAVVRRSRAD